MMTKLYKWFSLNFGLMGAIVTLPSIIVAGIYTDYNELIKQSMILVLFGVIYTQQLEILDLKDRLIRRWTESLGIPYAKDKTNEVD
jgi:hypothetical protein